MSAGAAPVVRLEGDSSVRHALRRLSVYIRRNWAYYLLCAVLTLGYAAGFVALPVAVGWAVDGAVQGLPREAVIVRCGWLVAIALGTAVLRYFTRTLIFNAAREVEYEIRNDLFAHLQRLPQSFYFRWHTGDLMSRCVNDLNSVRMLLGPALLQVLQTPIMFVAAFAVMAAISIKLALLVVVPYPLFIFIARGFGSAMHARSMAVQQNLGALSNDVQEGVSGIGVVKAYAMEDVQAARFARVNERLYRSHLRLVRMMAGMPAVIMLLPGLSMLFVLVLGGADVAAGRVGVGDFFTFAMYIHQLTFPTFFMGWVVALVQRGSAAMQRIDEVLSTDPSIADRADLEPVERLRGEIEFRGLTFRYPGAGREPALRDVSLHVPAGSSLGLVGPVGSGKTTLASVIPRLYEVEDGQVFLDGVDVNRIPLETLRHGIAMVPQDSFLFSMTLADNIAYGLPEGPPVAEGLRASLREQVEEAAMRAQLASDVEELPDGYETVVGERGVMLSGGQRQRAALARALALRPSILILDDTLSSVDAETEAAIQRELREVFRGRTVVVVANRVSSVRRCDHIAVLDRGRVVESGTHEQLIAAEGLYAKLAREQQQSRDREALERELEAAAHRGPAAPEPEPEPA